MWATGPPAPLNDVAQWGAFFCPVYLGIFYFMEELIWMLSSPLLIAIRLIS